MILERDGDAARQIARLALLSVAQGLRRRGYQPGDLPEDDQGTTRHGNVHIHRAVLRPGIKVKNASLTGICPARRKSLRYSATKRAVLTPEGGRQKPRAGEGRLEASLRRR